MECKAALRVSSDLPAIIGIYPEWNVKQERYEIRWHMGPIGIYPEWNVKGFIFNVFKKPV